MRKDEGKDPGRLPVWTPISSHLTPAGPLKPSSWMGDEGLPNHKPSQKVDYLLPQDAI